MVVNKHSYAVFRLLANSSWSLEYQISLCGSFRKN
jgi:hypothetical protein